MIIHSSLNDPNASEGSKQGTRFLAEKYGYAPDVAEAAPARVAQILTTLNAQLESQRARGSRFLVGNTLSALDIYWAAFAALIQPLPDELCRMHPGFRKNYLCTDPVVQTAASAQLLAHRDFIYHDYLELPVDM
jgi:glutathione S-transferase